MIISASYKTDIPTFYGQWFMNRLNAGYCKTVNPYNRHQISTISLKPDDVDGIVFWTKNLGPFVDKLSLVKSMGYPFIIQYAINAYPRTLEYSVVSAERSIEHMHLLKEQYGFGVAVWRYDPIIFTSVTSPDFHRNNFKNLARQLEGTTDEVVVSFAQIYKKTKRNMDWAAKEYNFDWSDPTDDEKLSLLKDLSNTAQKHGFRLTICTQPEYLIPSVGESHCIDAQRIMRVWGTRFKAITKGNRPGCMCAESKDIGDYDTCPHGCVYCYAVLNRQLAKKRYQEHDPDGEFLFPVKESELPKKDKSPQSNLFEDQ